ncbi:MAG: hypothetical protein AAF495_05615 [Pseudomonadota bacterium]
MAPLPPRYKIWLNRGRALGIAIAQLADWLTHLPEIFDHQPSRHRRLPR